MFCILVVHKPFIAMKFMNTTVLITGGGRGIGRSIARSFASHGARVCINYRSDNKSAQATLKSLEGDGHMVHRCDITDPDAVKEMIERCLESFGKLDVLVNNAGITRDNLLMRMKSEEWDDVINTNLTGVFRLSKACLRGMMKAKRGRIISIASVIGIMGNAGQANYAAAKAGMMGFSRSLAREIGSRGITVNVVAPGFIDTDMTRGLDEQQRGALLRDIPLQRLGAPGDIAAAVLFLASEQGGYITGQTLHVNGGMYMA